ncbi:MAG: aminotransferase class I/II-fold pyridoxal phosphate-dependent enzyme [Bacilli bacterium]
MQEKLRQLNNSSRLSCHVPGHKNGQFFRDESFRTIGQIDVTELDDTDDLHFPTGMIQEEQVRIANFYGAKQSFILVNGSTCGNLAAIYSQFQRGDSVYVQRDSHKSVFHALKLRGLKPILLPVQMCVDLGTSNGVSLDTFESIYMANPNGKGLILTTPTYFGTVRRDLEALIASAKQKGLVVIADEAHGAHFTLSGKLPPSALDLGADIVVQSMHKTLPALTMCAVLHVGGRSSADVVKLKQCLQIFQSSSPSFVLLSSVSECMNILENQRANVESAIDVVQAFRNKVNEEEHFKIGSCDADTEQDPFRFLLTSPHSGQELKKRALEVGLIPEMLYNNGILLILPIFCDQQWISQVEQKLSMMRRLLNGSQVAMLTSIAQWSIPSSIPYGFNELDGVQVLEMPLIHAEGKISAENVTPYPPGIPYIMEGEKITQHHIVELVRLQSQGYSIQAQQFEETGKISIYNLEMSK